MQRARCEQAERSLHARVGALAHAGIISALSAPLHSPPRVGTAAPPDVAASAAPPLTTAVERDARRGWLRRNDAKTQMSPVMP
jgi:hypothetical protein